MPEQENTSPTTGATPAPGPATGTNATTGATPQVAALTLEEALKKLADLEHSNTNASEEVERHRKKLTAYEKAEKEREAAAQAVKDAELGELERTKKQFSELQAKHDAEVAKYKQELINAQVKLAAKSMDFLNPDIAAKVIELEFGEDGMPTNVDQALEALAKSNPFLLKPKTEDPPATPAQTATRPPVTSPNNPGRASTSQPNSLPPGQIVTFDQVFNRQR